MMKNSFDNKKTLKRILSYIRAHFLFLILSLLFAVITVVSTLYTPILSGRAIDCMIGRGNVDFPTLYTILIRIAVVIAITAAAQWLMNLCNNRIAFRIICDIRTCAFSRLQELSVSSLDSHSHGDIASRIITDVEQFSDGLLMGFSQLFTGVLTIIGTLGFMIYLNYKIAVLVVVLTPLSILATNFIAKKTFHMFKKQSEARSELTSYVNEMIGSQKLVKTFSYEKNAQKHFDEANHILRKTSLRAIFFSSLTNPTTRFINGLVYSGVGILGALFSIQGLLTIGQLSCFLSYANQYTKPFNEISGFIAELQNALVCAGRVFELIDAPVQAPDAANAAVLDNPKGEVSLEKVFFSYRKEQPLIENLNLHISPGQRVAIVGPTGCGKSTLINLLMRFYDTDAGTIRVDGNPVAQVTRDSLRKSFGMVLQETWLKTGTIRENICFGCPDASEEDMIRAAKAAHAHPFIMRLPGNYDYVLTEDGGNLSQGEKQLLCIARVLIEFPPMLILDEATSSIDTRTEIHIQNAFAYMMKGRTSFIVAHRLSTIREADLILVMKDGHIIEQGTHQELLAMNGFYSSLLNSH